MNQSDVTSAPIKKPLDYNNCNAAGGSSELAAPPHVSHTVGASTPTRRGEDVIYAIKSHVGQQADVVVFSHMDQSSRVTPKSTLAAVFCGHCQVSTQCLDIGGWLEGTTRVIDTARLYALDHAKIRGKF